MPRRRADLKLKLNEAFAKRMAERQEAEGWSNDGLAARVSKYHHMDAATIWKIKKGDPPRRIDIDEMDAILRTFGAKSLDEFLDNGEYRAIAAEAEHISDEIARIDASVTELRRMLKRITRHRPARAWRQIRSSDAGGLAGWAGMVADLTRDLTDQLNAAAEAADRLPDYVNTHLSEESK